MSRARRKWLTPALGVAAWLAIGLFAVPALLAQLYRAEVVPAIANRPLDFYLSEWRGIVWYGAAVGAALLLFIRSIRSGAYADRFVPDARPSDLGAIRVLVGSVLLISTLWEDLASTAALPRAMMDPIGIMQVLALVPGYTWFTGSAAALQAFEWATALVLLFATIGWKTRWTVPLAAMMYLVLGGLLRQYAWFYHTGLIPLYLLIVLAFLPAGHGWSIDRELRRRRGKDVTPDLPSRRFGWARYAVWTAITLPYFAAGISKLRNGGLDWWEASNFKFILYQSALRPMEFDFDLSLAFATWPDSFFEVLAISALLGEVLYLLNLFSRRARWILPATMMLMHVGILLLQNILFFDLILLQAIFFNFRPLLRDLKLRVPVRRRLAFGETRSPTLPRHGSIAGRRVTVALAVLLGLLWVFRVEYYPFTGMQMFSHKRSQPVTYEVALAHTASGDVLRAPVEKSIRAMSDGRYRRVLLKAFDERENHVSQAFMQAVVERWNRQAPEGQRIRQIEIQRWEWYYEEDPDDEKRGSLVERVVYSFSGEEDSESKI